VPDRSGQAPCESIPGLPRRWVCFSHPQRPQGGIGARVWLGGEGCVHRGGGGIVLRHGWLAQQPLNGAQHRRSGVQGRVHHATLDKRAGKQADGAPRIHMVGAVLCIIFNHEHGSLVPVFALADALQQLAYCVVGVGHHGAWRESIRTRAHGVVFGQVHVDQEHQAALLIDRLTDSVG